MKKKIIHLSYFYKNRKLIKDQNSYIYCKTVYYSNSYFIDFYSYTHLLYAINLNRVNNNKIILDLGCADGPFLPTLNKYGGIVVGLDFNLEYIQRAKELKDFIKYPLNRVILLNAESHNLPFKNNSINLIFCLETLEHIPNSIKFVNEMYRVLKYGGVLIYSIPNEIGLSLLIRQVIGKFTGFLRENYTIKELFRNGILKKPSIRINDPFTHKNFDWRKIRYLINSRFKELSVIYSPTPYLGRLNPTLIFKTKKI